MTDEQSDHQAAHRRLIAESWRIEPGAKVLEIGCGQGDMTVVLAETVGPSGFVLAVDNADPSYGAPMTLGQAAEQIAASHLGSRIEFRFGFDAIRQCAELAGGGFDAVVLAHSSWYLASEQELLEVFRAARSIAQTLYFAEWDIEPSVQEQLPHMLSVIVQAQVEAFNSASISNIRTPLHKEQVRRLAGDAGWRMNDERAIDSPDLKDADWEIRQALAYREDELEAMNLPQRLRSLIDAERLCIQRFAAQSGNRPLSCYSFVFQRA